jgi:hypothetical protein
MHQQASRKRLFCQCPDAATVELSKCQILPSDCNITMQTCKVSLLDQYEARSFRQRKHMTNPVGVRRGPGFASLFLSIVQAGIITCMQVHCVPRPGKAGRERPVYETPRTLFSLHHINAWEANSSTIVIDTLARDTAHFAASDVTFLRKLEAPEHATSMRRLVMRGAAVTCRAFDTRAVPGLQGRSLNFPALLPPACTGHPHRAALAVVCCFP